MNFQISLIDEPAARDIITWHYPQPYQMYGLQDESAAEDVVAYLLNPQNRIYRIDNEFGKFLAFCSYGEDARVCGGNYEDDALDVGLGLRPELTGQGLGPRIIGEILAYALDHFPVRSFRVTIAAFNQRAQKAWNHHGFQKTQDFRRSYDQFPFVILTRPAVLPDQDLPVS